MSYCYTEANSLIVNFNFYLKYSMIAYLNNSVDFP